MENMETRSDFVIQNGVLKRYIGKEETVLIPDGIISIGRRAFGHCSNLKYVYIPESVKEIDDWAFFCSHLTEIDIPQSVTRIGVGAFCRCQKLKRITLPNHLNEIGSYAFQWCNALTTLTIPECVLSVGQGIFAFCDNLNRLEIHENILLKNQIFGMDSSIPKGLIPQVGELYTKMDDAAIKRYILEPTVWNQLAPDLQTEIFLNRSNKPLLDAYEKCISAEQAQMIANAILKKAEKKCTSKDCVLWVTFMRLFSQKLSDEILKTIYEKLKLQKNNAKALQAIEEDFLLSEMLCSEKINQTILPDAEQKIMDILKKQRLSVQKLSEGFQKYYGLSEKDLPKIFYSDETEANPLVAIYLMTAHGCGLFDEYEKAGISPYTEEIVQMLDKERFQNVLLSLADQYLGKNTRGRKLLIAEPICRYADEAVMRELTRRAPSWASSSSGIEAPPLKAFRNANLYSETRAAMMFADRYHELSRYARIRNTDEDLLRDRFLSDVGLESDGTKTYDLGNGTVTAVLQKDLSFLIHLENGKIAKSIPKKGADEVLYAKANADFTEMKKNVKKIMKNRKDVLFADFLSGHSRTAEAWLESYTKNPLLRFAASLLVWSQNRKTFLLTGNGAICSDGTPYEICSDVEISLAHPMEMEKDDLSAWQKYFTENQLKQPFEQIWEPVVDGESVSEDRYLGCMIPYYRLTKREKHGIFVTDEDFHDIIDVKFADCEAKIERIDWNFHEILPDDRFEIQSFTFAQYTRTVNHITAYLDRITVYGKILKDDVSIEQLLPNFTFAQIMDFIEFSAENNCVNVTALLLNYKNQNFSDFDPMDEFSLDF